jgi:hypothetical protein
VIKKLAEKHLPVKERTEVIKKVALEPEKPVEDVFKEVAEAPYEMHFVADDKELLLEGVKTQTSRTDMPDPKVKVGATVHAAIWEPQVADLRITSIERKRLRYFDDEDAKREEGCTLEQFIKKWKEAHGEWDENQLVYVIHFEKIK